MSYIYSQVKSGVFPGMTIPYSMYTRYTQKQSKTRLYTNRNIFKQNSIPSQSTEGWDRMLDNVQRMSEFEAW